MTQLPPPEQPYLGYATPMQEPPKGMATASMICGITSIPLLACAWFIAIPTAIVAVVLGFVARAKVRRGEAGGKGMALAGIICGFSSLTLAVVLIGGLIAFFIAAKSHPNWTAVPGPTTSRTANSSTITWSMTPAPVAAPVQPASPMTKP
jgi:hypothetical protein